MPGIRATSQSFARAHRVANEQGPDAQVPVPKGPRKTPRPTAKAWGYDAPTIVVHNHMPRPRCCHTRKKRPRAKTTAAPSVPEVPLTGWRGVAQRNYRRAKRAGLFLLQAAMLISSMLPRVSVGIGINPVWPESWPSFMRRR